MNARRLAIPLAASALAVALCGCVSLLPKTKPDQLYSLRPLDAAPAASAARAPGAIGVLLVDVNFPRAALGDGILTTTGSQNAYLAQSRWVAPASVLFREAVEQAFDASQRTRLMARGEIAGSALLLRLEVRDFQALYPGGPGSIPVVVVSMGARLTTPQGETVADTRFDVRKPAADNRVGPIVAAFNGAVGEATKGLVAWTDQAAATAPAAAQSAARVSAPAPRVVTSTTTTTTTPAR